MYWRSNLYQDSEECINDCTEFRNKMCDESFLDNRTKRILELRKYKKKKKQYTKKCLISNCPGRAPVNRVFKFPSNINVAQKWRKACGLSSNCEVLNKRVCERHFPAALLKSKYLPTGTIPTLRLPLNSGAIDDEKDDQSVLIQDDDTFIEDGTIHESSVEMEIEEEPIDGPYGNDDPNLALPIVDYNLDIFDDVKFAEIELYKSHFPNVKKIINRRSHCTICDVHIGTAPINEAIIKMHPILRVTVCKECFTFYNTGGFECGDDGSELYCRWCGQGGELYCCSNCPYVFCHNCISVNFPKKTVAEIQNDENWKCFACDPGYILKLRADHWALLNFIEQQKLEITRISSNESEVNRRMSRDVSTCCNESIKRLVIKRKPDNTADIPVPEPKKKALEQIAELEHSKTQDSVAVVDPPIMNIGKPVATVRPTESSVNKPPPKILNNLLARKAEEKKSKSNARNDAIRMQNKPEISNSSSTVASVHLTETPTLRLLQPAPGQPNIPPLVPAGLVLQPSSVQNIAVPRTMNPVYHTVNGFCIDLNSAAQQDIYRLPNGKIIQVRRQSVAPNAQSQVTNSPPVPITLQNQTGQRLQGPAQFLNNFNQMGQTVVQPVMPQNQTNKPPPLAVAGGAVVCPNNTTNSTVETSHVQLGQQISNTVQAYQHLNNKIKTLTNCSAFKSVNTLTDVKDLTMHLTYLLNYSIGRLQNIRNDCTNNLKMIETEINKQNKVEDNDFEIIETNKEPIINLDDSDDDNEEGQDKSNNLIINNNCINLEVNPVGDNIIKDVDEFHIETQSQLILQDN